MSTFKLTGPSSTASPNVRPEDALNATATDEKDVTITFMSCLAQQRKNVDQLRSARAMHNKDKLDDLKKFADSFKLHTPAPTDLVSLMAKDPAKQKEIQEKAKRNTDEAKPDLSAVVTALPIESDTAATRVSVTTLPAEISTSAILPLASPVKPFSSLAIRPKATPKSPAKILTLGPNVRKFQPLKTLPDAHRHTLERKLGHIFENPNLLWEALQAHGNGIKMIGDRKIEDGNKKLALLGDCVIKMVILNDWFETSESRRQGHGLSSSIGCNRNLDKCGREVGLEAFINPHSRFLDGGLHIPPRTMSATVEALIGAIFLDSGKSLRVVKIAMKGLGLLKPQK